ncbi:MAG TPA: type II secretion system F family protein [Burkholderiaceae bacterium]|nr:type II secretion system F family protein [Burkholderiaceae bacterium]
MSDNAQALFEVVAVSPQGSLLTERLRAADAAKASEQVRLRGLRVLSCREMRAASGQGWRRRRLDVGLFTDELAALLDAGLGMVDTLRTLAQKERDTGARQALEAVTRDVIEGQALSAALSNRGGVFPTLLVASVSASEQTGDLVSALRRFSTHLESMRMLRGKLVGAAIYPALLLAVGSLVVLFLLGVVVPRFAVLLEGASKKLPLASQMLLGWGKSVAAHPVIFVTGFVAVVLLIAFGLLRAARSGWQIPGLQRAWLIGRLVRLFRHAQFYRTTSMLVQGGIPVLRAFEMSRRLLAEEDQLGLDGARRQIAEGRPIGPALAQAQIADTVALRMLEVAQKTGRLADVLSRIATFQEQELSRAIDLTARLVEPLLMIFIGLVIGAIVVLMYMPIFDLATSLQ